MDSFDILYEKYSKDVFRFLYRLCAQNPALAEDLMQETFLYAYLGITNFKGECSVKTWLLQIAKNRFFLNLRSKKRESHNISFDEWIPVIAEEGSGNVCEQLYQEQILSDSLDIVFEFPEKMKAVFLQRIYCDLSYREIAGQLFISEGSAKMLFHRAKLLLRKKLREVYGYEV